MTATQVFFRFAKDSGYYHILRKSSYKTINHRCIKDTDYDSLKVAYGNCNFIIDKILKYNAYCLSDILYLFYSNDSHFRILGYGFFDEINKKWHKYLKENINGNYYKKMIIDSRPEIDRFKLRNGYHVLNFTFKENKQ